jgi:flagellar motor component MotA
MDVGTVVGLVVAVGYVSVLGMIAKSVSHVPHILPPDAWLSFRERI